MGFELVHRVTGDGDITYSKFRSSLTGMTCVIAGVRGSVVRGRLLVATEAHDDDGIPHTLEHLCFLGSEDWPFKGVLELMATRCLASGINAYTDTDHTCYTMSTVGTEGFLRLLPVYLDHLLFPTLTDDGYVTEVHHVNGAGEDAGVVYAEMQARENTGAARVQRTFLRHMYPGHGYSAETGGMLANLRHSLTMDKIRAYHSAFYRPENLCVIISGVVDDEKVLQCLTDFEDKILHKRAQNEAPPFKRPWFQEPVPPLSQTVEQVIEFPCDQEDRGIVQIGWRGPDSRSSFNEIVCLGFLLSYLTETVVSPLQQALLQIEEPFCSSVTGSTMEHSVSCIMLRFSAVNLDKMSQVKDKLFAVLNDVASGVTPMDMERMRSMIHQMMMRFLDAVESNPHSAVPAAVVSDFLHGTSKEDLEVRVNGLPFYAQLAQKDSGFWTGLIQRWFLSQPFVCVLARPSTALMQSMAQAEKERIAGQVEALGPEGLEKKAAELESAKQKNDVPPPDHMVSDVPIPSVEGIYFHDIDRFTNDPEVLSKTEDKLGLARVPFRLQVDDLETNFVSMTVLLNTSEILGPEERLYLRLLCALLTQSAVLRDDVLIPYEEVVRRLQDDTIMAGAGVGAGGHLAQLVSVSVRLEESKYEKGVRWLHDLLWGTQFQAERVNVMAKRMTSAMGPAKRRGSVVAGELMSYLLLDERSNSYACGLFRQHAFLHRLTKRLQDEPDSVVRDLTSVRDKMVNDLSNFRVHVSCNLKHLQAVVPDLIELWVSPFLPEKIRGTLCSGTPIICRPATPAHGLLNPASESQSLVSGLGSIESSFLHQTVASMKSVLEPDYASLIVLIEYLTQIEGPMWNQIRGSGLSYDFSMSQLCSKGTLTFKLSKATQLVPAYEAAARIVKAHIDGREKWEQQLLESAQASLIASLIKSKDSIQAVAGESMLNYLRGVDMGHSKELLSSVAKVRLEDLPRVAATYLSPLFQAKGSVRRSVVCKSASLDQISADFQKLGVDLTPISLEKEISCSPTF